MEKVIKIRQRDDIDIYRIMSDAHFEGSGTSKEAFEKDNIIYKVPQGADEFYPDCFATKIDFPYEMEDFEEFVNIVFDNHEGLVWSLGQFAIEIMVWEHLKELEKQGYDISGFAAIKDYYFDKNGIIVIEQEYVTHEPGLMFNGWKSDVFKEENKSTLGALLDMGFELSDLSNFNLEYNNDLKVKCFDFGLSKNNILFDYDTYEDYCNYGSRDDYDEDEYDDE